MHGVEDKRVVVILGMHRSGTSAVTRGLVALGVYLGDDLIGAQADNPTGFWEDRHVLAICERALELRGMSSVSVRFPRESGELDAGLTALADEAVEQFSDQFGARALWGFKNPRTARILPFWQEVFRRLDVHDTYVIVCRNPLSVARSLEVRNGIAPAKSHLLWLQHTVSALAQTVGKPRVAVDYDDFLDDPRRHLERIASALGIDAESSHAAIEEYANEFLVADLRHTQFTLDDLDADPAVPGFVRSIYRYVQQAARDEISLDAEELAGHLAAVNDALAAMDPVFGFLEQREHEVFAAWTEVSAQRQRIDELQQALERESPSAVAAQIAAVTARVQELADALSETRLAAAASDAVVASVRAALAETEQQLALTQQQVAATQQGVLASATQVDSLEGRLRDSVEQTAQQQGRIATLEAQLSALQARMFTLEGTIENLDDRRQRQETTIREQAAEIERLTAAAAAREQEGTVLVTRLETLDADTARLTSRVHVLEDAHAFAREALTRQETQISTLEGEGRQREWEIAALTEAVRARDAELQSMRRSLSWRVTAPLRALRRTSAPTGAPAPSSDQPADFEKPARAVPGQPAQQ